MPSDVRGVWPAGSLQREGPGPPAVGGWGARRVFLLTFGHSGGQVGVAGKEMSEPRSGKPVTVGDLEIEPIERVVVRVENVCGVIVVVALKEPVAVILRSPQRHMASGFGEPRMNQAPRLSSTRTS